MFFFFFLLLLLVFFWWDWGFELGTLPLELYLQSIFALVILEMGSCKLFAQVDLKAPSS
jgi:hypothetical protein